ncbi:MAG: TonB-dependent receptor [Acidobacteria bacterium]|nr:TonB-dependent receptor [Acidobacteriota bacterium]
MKGATVEIASAQIRAQTDAEGRFTLTLPIGEYELRVIADGFIRITQHVSLAAQTVNLTIQLEPALLIEDVAVTPARAAVRLEDAPASISLLDARDVQNAGAQTTDDLLRQIPGFSLFRRASSLVANPTTGGVSLRGAGASGASRTLVLQDGVPLNDAFGGWVYWDRVPRTAIERIEVVRGGASDLYGSDALSGVINLLTRPPASRHVNVEGSYGNRDTGEVSFFASEKWKSFGATLSGEAFRTDGYFLLAPTTRGTADAQAASKHRVLNLRLQNDFNAHSYVFARGTLFDEDRANGTVLQYNDTANESLAVGGRVQTGEGSTWELTVFGNQQRYHQSFTAVAANRNSETLSRLQFVPARDAGLSFNWSRLNAGKHLLVAGLDVRGVRGTSDEIVYANNRATSFVSAGGRQRRAGGFLQGIFQLTSKLSLTASGRYDDWRNSSAASVTRTLATGAVVPRFFAPRSESAFSPRLALSYAVAEHVNLHVAGYRAFRAPTLNELYRSFRVGDTLTQSNEKLTAERLTGGEAGVTAAAWQRTRFRATGFWTETINPVANFTLSATPTLITRERRNLGRTRSRGLEAEAEFNPAKHWQITAGYLLVDATIRRAPQDARLEGLWVPQVARHQFTLQTAYAHPRFVTAAVQFRAIGKQFDDDQNLLPLGNFAVVDATVARPLGRWFEVFVAVQNLLDEKIVVGRTPLETLGMPRLVRGGVRLKLER